MNDLAVLLNQMLAEGVIENYALFGAIAQMRYTEPVATLDVDVLVALPHAEKLDSLGEIYQFCRARGYAATGEAFQVGTWPVQFVPVFSELTREAMERAETVDFEGATLRVVRPEYLAVIALATGRAKDHARILALLESGSTPRSEIADLAARHGLTDAWKKFENRFLDG